MVDIYYCMKTVKESNIGLSYGRGYVYSIQYHIVFCTKYRLPVLCNGLDAFVKNELKEIADTLNFTITAVEVMPDHVHILIECTPQLFIPTAIKIIKGNIARKLFLRFPNLKKKLYGGHLWNPSYCVTTVSDRTTEMIKHYINNQQ